MMSDFIGGLILLLALFGTLLWLALNFYAGVLGYSNGQLDRKYPNGQQRSDDRYLGLRRAVYEFAYKRGWASEGRVIERRNARND